MALTTCSITRCARSVYPSLYGWNAVEKANLVRKIAISARQKALVHRGSRSEISSCGTPKSRTTRSKKMRATSPAPRLSSPIRQGVSRTSLVSRSTQVNTQLYPLTSGKCVIKSMLQDAKRSLGTCKG